MQKHFPFAAAAVSMCAAAMILAVTENAAAIDTGPLATTAERLQMLENKTDYYKKINRKIIKTYTRPARAAAAASCEFISIIIDPRITLGGVSYAWVTATATYEGSPFNIDMNWAPVGDGHPCGKAVSAPTSGTAVIKQFCFFSVEKGDKYRLMFTTGKSDPCTTISELTVEMKTTNIEVIEPE